MKKVHVKLNRVLAIVLSALMVCLSVPMDHVLAETVTPGDAAEPGGPGGENVTESVLPGSTAGENGTEGMPGTENVPGTEGVPEEPLTVSAPVEASGADAGIAAAAEGEQTPYLFSYDGETAAEGVLGLSQVSQWGKTGALTFTKDKEFSVPVKSAITSGTAVYEMELCPASKCKQSIVFKNSKGDTLFAFVANAADKKYYLADQANGTSQAELGSYVGDTWCRIRTELYLDESTDGLKFRVSVIQQKYPEGVEANSKYSAEGTVWELVKSITQADLKTANGTVTAAIDGSEDHPFDLGAITLSAVTNSRWCGDMFLSDITDVTLAAQPGEQTGTDFVPGDAAVKVTYSTGAEQTIRLADLLYKADYTTEKSDEGNYVICYGGKKLETAVAVPAPTVTGIQIKTPPTKKTYAIGETFDDTGLEVEALMSDKTTQPLTAEEYTVSKPDTSAAGIKEVTVTYKDDENEEFTATFKIRVADNSNKNPALFDYTSDALNVDELGLTGDTAKVELSETAVAGSTGQHLTFTDAGTVTKSWEAVKAGIVKINLEFNQANKKIAHFRLKDGEGNLLINFIQQASGNVNLYKNTDTKDSYESVLLAKENLWIRLETEIDLTASNAEQKLQFTTKSFYKETYEGEWIPGEEVTNALYEEWGNLSGCCLTEIPAEFSVGSLEIQGSAAGVAYDNIEVIAVAPAKSQSFVYTDAEDITDLELEASGESVLGVHKGEVSGNETNKLSIVEGSVTKTIEKPITSGIVTLETVGHPNGKGEGKDAKILGVQILDSQGRNLITYSQQNSGNLNLYYGTDITGTSNAGTIAENTLVSTNKWIKVTTEINLNNSNASGVLAFTITTQYKDSYTDAEWKSVGSYTQQMYVDKGLADGAAVDGITSFDIGAIKITSKGGTSYVDDIVFNDGNGVEGLVTITDKVLKSIAITTPATVTEFVQDSKVSAEGMVLTGTYDVTYSNGVKETKEYKISKYDVICDTSQVADSVPVTIKVTDNGQEFTETYNVKIIPKPDGSYVTFSYTDESSVAQTGFGGSQISVDKATVSGNASSKIKLGKGTSTKTLAEPCTTGTVHFETEFLTTATSKASLFLRILNSEGKPMIDIAQYGSGNLNLYIDRNTSGTDGAMAGQFQGLPVKQWAKLSVDIDLDQTKEQGHLMFDAVVWTKADYAGDWSVHAEFNQDLYLKSTTAPTTTGAASTDATIFDVASIELENQGGTNYYDNMFFEAIRGDVQKELINLWIEKPAEKTDYTVGDGLNRTGLVLKGTYKYTFKNGDVKERTAEVTKYDISFDNTQPGEVVTVTLTAGGKSVSYDVTVRPNTALDDIEEYLVNYINNKLVNLDADNIIHVNKRQIRFPVETAKGESLAWAVASGDASVSENVLTVVPSKEGETEVSLIVTLSTTNNDGDPVKFSKTIKLSVPMERGKAVDDSLTTEESLKNAIAAMYARGLFEGQEYLTGVDAIMESLGRDITVEEIAVILVNMFNIDTTYANTKISRKDVADDEWYSRYVKAAFQLSVETRDSREGKEEYGIGKGISRDNLQYMIDRIVKIDQTTMPSDYADRMFE